MKKKKIMKMHMKTKMKKMRKMREKSKTFVPLVILSYRVTKLTFGVRMNICWKWLVLPESYVH
jgi:hypothetical protein